MQLTRMINTTHVIPIYKWIDGLLRERESKKIKKKNIYIYQIRNKVYPLGIDQTINLKIWMVVIDPIIDDSKTWMVEN